ncbi:MAG: hypothetical protein JOZ52_13855 [Acidobacteria bacterium]|nr:hypothetical protein [Acidobacteriota bacterium]
MKNKRQDDLEIARDRGFEKLTWLVQRVSWVLLLLAAVGALLGLFGQGVLSDRVAGDKNSALWIEYSRFARMQAETATLRAHFGAGAGTGGQVRFNLSRDYVEAMQVLSISPEPEAIEAAADHLTYIFRVPDSAQATTVTFHFEPERMGRLHARAAIDGGQALELSQFVYP